MVNVLESADGLLLVVLLAPVVLGTDDEGDAVAEVVADGIVLLGDVDVPTKELVTTLLVEEVIEVGAEDAIDNVVDERGVPPVICGFAAKYVDLTTACAPGVLDNPVTLKYSIHLPLASTATATHAFTLLHVCRQPFNPVAACCCLLIVLFVIGTPEKLDLDRAHIGYCLDLRMVCRQGQWMSM